jgi:hypothetical protein
MFDHFSYSTLVVIVVVVIIFCYFLSLLSLLLLLLSFFVIVVIAVSVVFVIVVAIIVWQTTLVYDNPDWTITHFYHFLSSFQTSTIFEENSLNFFGLASSPILH